MRLTITYALLGWLLSLPAPARAADSAIERATLTGLTTMSVVVEGLPPIAEKNGLTSAALQADVTRRLRQAGISIIEDADAYLYVHVTIADAGASLPLPYVVDVSLMQEVTLPRGIKTRTPLQCPTWGLNRLGLVGATLVRSAVADRVTEFVDQFITAYRSVNPKP
ncbi:MAG: hypothetical protein HY047_00600 [Acidobacteria bacterium]|nr:hypothetical protein [Acidobacteriota bacterium]